LARSDAELVQQTLAGDREAFGVLVERHRRTVFALALSHGLQAAEAEDAAQETFIRAFSSLAELREPAAFARWVYGIAGHVRIDRARAAKRRPETNNHEQLPERPDLGLPEGLDPNHAEAFRAITALPEDQRVVVTLRYLEGLSPKEIAERLGEPRGTIRSRLHHALSYLQTAFGGAPRQSEAREPAREPAQEGPR